jgi:RNA polymerase I-specific transcription initiation factor RRN7
MNIQEKDVFTMSSNQLDQYLDWYQDTFVDEFKMEEGPNGDFRRTICDMFPLDPDSTSRLGSMQSSKGSMRVQHMNTVKAVHADFKPVMVVEEENERPDTVRPGHQYRFYKDEKQLPEQAKRFYEMTARIAGLPMDMLVLAVFFAEKRAQKWMVRQR